MWKAIRIHPWRLEIVPAAAFALAVWSAFVFHYRAIATARLVPELPVGWMTALSFLCIGWALFNWLIGFGQNHNWVLSERRKQFNTYALIPQCGVITAAWFGYALDYDFGRLLHRLPPDIPLPLLAAMIAVGIGTTAFLERSRRYVPRDEVPEPPLPVGAADAGCYREIVFDWWHFSTSLLLLLCLVGLFAAAAVAHARGLTSETGSIRELAVAVCGVLIVSSLGRNALIISPSAVSCWWGIFPIKLAVTDIASCAVGDPDSTAKRPGKKVISRRSRGSRFIEITMTNGRIYRLGALRPTHICKLIGKPAEDLPPSPS